MAGQGFSVINNLNSLTSQRNLGLSTNGLDSSLARMSSGRRINNAGDDAAGLAIGSALNADYMALTQAVRNANDGVGIIQVADGAFSQMSDMLGRATQLATQAASGTLGTNERKTVDAEFQQILQEIDRVVNTTNFKGEQLLSQDGAVNKSVYVGDTQLTSNIDLSIGGETGSGTQALGLQNANLTTAENAQDALSRVQDALSSIAQMRGSLGAQQNRMVNSIGVIQIQSQNILAAESSIMDADMATEVSNFTKNRILMQSGMASLAQSNATNKMVLQLFQ